MKLFFCLAMLLPCIVASQWEYIKCPDGKECPIGKTCCEKEFEGIFQCCDLAKGVALNKKIIPAVFSNPTVQVSLAEKLGFSEKDTCPGTLCKGEMCCMKYTDATCCSSERNCCPPKYTCCGNSTSPAWCCPQKYRCHENYGYCQSGSIALSPAIAILLAMTFFLVSKFF